MIRCKFEGCDFATPVHYRKKNGKLGDGWARLDRHMESVHRVEVNVSALHARGSCDDRDGADPRDLAHTPEPGAPLTDPRRRAP